ncbi:lipoprotein [Marinicella sp. W31]
MKTFKTFIKLTCAGLLALTMLSCGNKGDLYLPEEPAETEQTTDG